MGLPLLLLLSTGAAAQEAAGSSLRRSVSAGYVVGTLGYRLGTLEIAGEVEPRGFLSARVLIGSRPQLECAPGYPFPGCGERATFAAVLGGLQWAAVGYRLEPYMGGQVGYSYYEGVVSPSYGLLAAAQTGARLRLGPIGGVHGEASYLFSREGGFPIAGVGVYLYPGSLGGIQARSTFR